MTEKELSADMELLKRGLKMGKYILKQDAISVLVNEAKTHNNPVKRAYTRAAALIEQIKAEDVQPIKHGRWSECYTDTHHYSGICSVCGKASIKSLAESLYAFCPKCGARMDGALNDKYNVDAIMSIVSQSNVIFDTPHDYCVDYSYEETHSITLEDLRDILTDLFKKKRGD